MMETRMYQKLLTQILYLRAHNVPTPKNKTHLLGISIHAYTHIWVNTHQSVRGHIKLPESIGGF